jgi:predicted dehydrogenase
MENISLAQIGAGYWGTNLSRNLVALGALKVICDTDINRHQELQSKYPNINIISDYQKILTDPNISGVVIATPASTHYDIAKKALEAGKHIFVEKPFTTDYSRACELVSLAKKNNLIIMIGMIFLYNMAVRKIKELIDSGDLGEIHYVFFQRRNLGKVRTDVNAWWNLAPHDISILVYWLEKKILNLNVRGFDFIQPGIEDVTMASLELENKISAFIHTSWLDPSKVRKAIVVGSQKMAIYDDMSSDMKVIVYDKGIDKSNIYTKLGTYETFGDFQLKHRAGDIYVPKVDFSEPLRIECQHFIDCIKHNEEPISSGEKNLEMVKILQAGEESIKNKGKLIEL